MNTLTEIIIKNAKRQEKQETIKEKILSAIAFLIVFLSLAVTMIVTSIYVTKELNKINQEYMFINILLLMNFIILFGKSIFESLNALYFSKDLKILLRMPIKSKDIVKGKIINMIISEYQMETIMLAIPMIIYGIMEKVQPQFYLYALIILLVLPVIPIMITSTIIAIIMRFTNGIKNKTLVMYMTIILSLVALDFVFTGFNHSINLNVSDFENSVLRINGISEKIAEQFILIKPIMNTLLNYNNIKGIQNLVLYLLESGLTYILGILAISKIYLKGAIGTTINGKRSERTAEKLNIEDFKNKNKNIAYLEKDIKLMSRTPIFCIQCLIIPIVYPLIILFVLLIAIAFSRLVGVDLIADLTKEMNTSKMQAIFICVGEVFFMMNFSSIIGISKESKSAILTKTIPIDYQKQFNMKTYIGKFLNMLATIIVTLAYYETTKNIQATIVMFAILYLLNSIGEKVKLYIDLRKPQIEWESEYAMMKQNTNIMNVLFYTLAILVIVVAISQLISSPSIYLAVILIITLIANFTINNYISKNKNKIFKKIY
mgnify:CR=1 FL=1